MTPCSGGVPPASPSDTKDRRNDCLSGRTRIQESSLGQQERPHSEGRTNDAPSPFPSFLPYRHAAQRVAVCMFLMCLSETTPALCQSTPSLSPGTFLWARLDRKVSSKTAHIGDKVEAVTVKPVKRHGQVVLPADTRLLGAVEAVRTGDRPHKTSAQLKLLLTEMILPDGRRVSTKASLELRAFDGRIWRYAALGLAGEAGLGALIGVGWGAKGAGIGAAVGGGIGLLGFWPLARSRWRDIELCDCRTLALRLDEALMLPPVHPAKP